MILSVKHFFLEKVLHAKNNEAQNVLCFMLRTVTELYFSVEKKLLTKNHETQNTHRDTARFSGYSHTHLFTPEKHAVSL